MKYEQEMEDLKRNMTVKMQKKKEAMTMRIQKKEQEKTAELVQVHSEQMLELLKAKEAEAKQEIEQEIVSTLIRCVSLIQCIGDKMS